MPCVFNQTLVNNDKILRSLLMVLNEKQLESDVKKCMDPRTVVNPCEIQRSDVDGSKCSKNSIRKTIDTDDSYDRMMNRSDRDDAKQGTRSAKGTKNDATIDEKIFNKNIIDRVIERQFSILDTKSTGNFEQKDVTFSTGVSKDTTSSRVVIDNPEKKIDTTMIDNSCVEDRCEKFIKRFVQKLIEDVRVTIEDRSVALNNRSPIEEQLQKIDAFESNRVKFGPGSTVPLSSFSFTTSSSSTSSSSTLLSTSMSSSSSSSSLRRTTKVSRRRTVGKSMDDRLLARRLNDITRPDKQIETMNSCLWSESCLIVGVVNPVVNDEPASSVIDLYFGVESIFHLIDSYVGDRSKVLKKELKNFVDMPNVVTSYAELLRCVSSRGCDFYTDFGKCAPYEPRSDVDKLSIVSSPLTNLVRSRKTFKRKHISPMTSSLYTSSSSSVSSTSISLSAGGGGVGGDYRMLRDNSIGHANDKIVSRVNVDCNDNGKDSHRYKLRNNGDDVSFVWREIADSNNCYCDAQTFQFVPVDENELTDECRFINERMLSTFILRLAMSKRSYNIPDFFHWLTNVAVNALCGTINRELHSKLIANTVSKVLVDLQASLCEQLSVADTRLEQQNDDNSTGDDDNNDDNEPEVALDRDNDARVHHDGYGTRKMNAVRTDNRGTDSTSGNDATEIEVVTKKYEDVDVVTKDQVTTRTDAVTNDDLTTSIDVVDVTKNDTTRMDVDVTKDDTRRTNVPTKDDDTVTTRNEVGTTNEVSKPMTNGCEIFGLSSSQEAFLQENFSIVRRSNNGNC